LSGHLSAPQASEFITLLIVRVLMNNGDGTFSSASNLPAKRGVRGRVGGGDFNEDGRLDLAATGCVDSACKYGFINILLGNGDGTLGTVTSFDSTALEPGAIAARDLNGDGKLDLVVANAAHPAIVRTER
jgi:hypothetical protein